MTANALHNIAQIETSLCEAADQLSTGCHHHTAAQAALPMLWRCRGDRASAHLGADCAIDRATGAVQPRGFCGQLKPSIHTSASVPCGCYGCVRSKKQVSRVQSGLKWLAAMTTVRRFTQALKCSRNAAVPSGRFLKSYLQCGSKRCHTRPGSYNKWFRSWQARSNLNR